MGPPLTSTPAGDGFRMPGEFEPHAGCWMLWPERPDNWRLGGAPAQRAFAAVAAAINDSEPVTVGVSPGQLERARAALAPSIRVVELESDDAWMRDVGPTFVRSRSGERRGVDWRFNAWGGNDGGLYSSWERDDAVAARVLELEAAPRYRAPIVLEGGSIHVDGQGTVLTTEECLLNRNRNPSLDREQIERALCEYLGAEKVLWLGRGLPHDETDGHVDNLACFAAPGVVMLSHTDDSADPRHESSEDALRRLQDARDARGRKLEIVLLPSPGALAISEEEARGVEELAGTQPRRAGDPMAGSYANFYIANDRIVHPLLDEQTDARAAEVLAATFPAREIVGVPAREILLGGGNIHCITQQVPR
jgi:agmatine deiminase